MLTFRWPVDLPSLEVIEHVVGVFFERVPLIPKMLHKATFKANLQLPPTHWKFPVSSFLRRRAKNRPDHSCTVYWPSLPITCQSKIWPLSDTSLLEPPHQASIIQNTISIRPKSKIGPSPWVHFILPKHPYRHRAHLRDSSYGTGEKRWHPCRIIWIGERSSWNVFKVGHYYRFLLTFSSGDHYDR